MSKQAIPQQVRRDLALRAGAIPGEGGNARCEYCGRVGQVYWRRLYSGRPGGWVTFADLEIDHVHPELHGGVGATENMLLACQPCNRSKGHRLDWVSPKGETPVEVLRRICGAPAEELRREGGADVEQFHGSSPALRTRPRGVSDQDQDQGSNCFRTQPQLRAKGSE